MLIAFGIYALKVMDKNEFPNFTIREGVVGAIYPGATVEQIDDEVLKPLEDYIFSYKEVDKAKTHSQITAGTLIIFVELDDNVENTDSFWNGFKIGMENVKLKLPPGVLGVETLAKKSWQKLPLKNLRSRKFPNLPAYQIGRAHV